MVKKNKDRHEAVEEQTKDKKNMMSEDNQEQNEEVLEEEVTEEEKYDSMVQEYEEKLANEEGKYLKLLAEFENFKRRNRQEAELKNKYKEQKFAEDLLPVIDNLERALQVEGDSNAYESLKKGVEMIHQSFVDVLKQHEVTVIESTGEVFDPNVHQAVMTEASDDVESGVVIEEFQKGYLLKDRVIRPSMVKVSE